MQGFFLLSSIKDYAGTVDTFVDARDFSKRETMINANQLDNPKHNPKVLLKLVLYDTYRD